MVRLFSVERPGKSCRRQVCLGHLQFWRAFMASWLCGTHHCSRLTPSGEEIDTPSYYLIGVVLEIVQKNGAGKWLGSHTPRRWVAPQLGGGILGLCWYTSTCQGQYPLEALQKLQETQLYLFLTLGASILWALLFLALSQLQWRQEFVFLSSYLSNVHKSVQIVCLKNKKKVNAFSLRRGIGVKKLKFQQEFGVQNNVPIADSHAFWMFMGTTDLLYGGGKKKTLSYLCWVTGDPAPWPCTLHITTLGSPWEISGDWPVTSLSGWHRSCLWEMGWLPTQTNRCW